VEKKKNLKNKNSIPDIKSLCGNTGAFFIPSSPIAIGIAQEGSGLLLTALHFYEAIPLFHTKKILCAL